MTERLEPPRPTWFSELLDEVQDTTRAAINQWFSREAGLVKRAEPDTSGSYFPELQCPCGQGLADAVFEVPGVGYIDAHEDCGVSAQRYPGLLEYVLRNTGKGRWLWSWSRR